MPPCGHLRPVLRRMALTILSMLQDPSSHLQDILRTKYLLTVAIRDRARQTLERFVTSAVEVTMLQELMLAKFLQKDKVCLRIDADTWVIGVIITVVHICTKLAGGKYVVEYLSIDGSGRRERREVSNEVLMPYQPGG
ncbi:hypothetical protein BC827DRAFT_1156199 [Russula dissimulans]|nr:hypothetical protein BC827DRAFT_1156199 [Russula dissimulans]